MSILAALIWAVIYCAIVGLVGYILLWFCRKAPGLPSFIPVVIQFVIAIICLIILVNLLVPAVGGPNPFH